MGSADPGQAELVGDSIRGAGEGRLCPPKQLGERQEADGWVRAEAAAVWGRPYGAERLLWRELCKLVA